MRNIKVVAFYDIDQNGFAQSPFIGKIGVFKTDVELEIIENEFSNVIYALETDKELYAVDMYICSDQLHITSLATEFECLDRYFLELDDDTHDNI